MAVSRPFRFGVSVTGAASFTEWRDTVQRAESLGYSSLLVPDHFGPQFAPIAAMAAAAAVTSTIRIGCFVFANDFRHPAVLAKEMATLDVLSDGRVELGIGAGWMRHEYEAAGIPFERPGRRLGKMYEGVEILKRFFTEERFSFQGEHYTVAGLRGWPTPVQSPHPPILIGGGGRQLLSFAAREVDIVGLIPLAAADGHGLEVADATPEATDQKIGWIRAAAGARFPEIELNVFVFEAIVTSDRLGTARTIAEQFGASVEHVLQTPYVLVGSVDEIEADLLARRERYGISYIVVAGDRVESFAPVVARLAGR